MALSRASIQGYSALRIHEQTLGPHHPSGNGSVASPIHWRGCLTMAWWRKLPWQRKKSGDRLVIAWFNQSFCYLQARADSDGVYQIGKVGVLQQGADSLDAFHARVGALGLGGGEVYALLGPGQYQLLQIDMPAVPADELRAAARYQIRDRIDTHLDDLTIDVMPVGDGQQKGTAQLYVVAAVNSGLQSVTALAQRQRWPLGVIDIQETAQRNLQLALLGADTRSGLAHAALVVDGGKQALLTIVANGELFYSRRIDLPEGFMALDWSGADVAAQVPDVQDSYLPVAEYQPDYSGSASFDYSVSAGTSGAAFGGAVSDTERAQRLLVEVQRSLDLWDRTQAALPLRGLRVFAGDRSEEMAAWLTRDLGQTVGVLDSYRRFPELMALAPEDCAACLPLLGVLLRGTV